MSVKDPVRSWKRLSTRYLLKAEPWIEVMVDTIELPSGRIVEDYYRVDLPDYVMIYATNPDGRILLVRQYKQALDEVLPALPTGIIDDGESPRDAAQRELLEETGYASDNWASLGAFQVDGNKGCGTAYFFSASNIRKLKDPIWDDMEETEVIFDDPENFLTKIANGDCPLIDTAALMALATNPIINNVLKKP